jgi:hypothetical protein
MLCLFKRKLKKYKEKNNLKPSIAVVPHSFVHVNSGTGFSHDVGPVPKEFDPISLPKSDDFAERFSILHPLRSNPPLITTLSTANPSEFDRSFPHPDPRVKNVGFTLQAVQPTSDGIPSTATDTIDQKHVSNTLGGNYMSSHMSNSEHFNRRSVPEFPLSSSKFAKPGYPLKPRPYTIGAVEDLFLDGKLNSSIRVYQGKWQTYMQRLPTSGSVRPWTPLSIASAMSDSSHPGFQNIGPAVSPYNSWPIFELPGSVNDIAELAGDVPVENPDLPGIPNDLIAELTEGLSVKHNGNQNDSFDDQSIKNDSTEVGILIEKGTAVLGMQINTDTSIQELDDKIDIPSAFPPFSSSSSLESLSKWLASIQASSSLSLNDAISGTYPEFNVSVNMDVNAAHNSFINWLYRQSPLSDTSSEYNSFSVAGQQKEILDQGKHSEGLEKAKMLHCDSGNASNVYDPGFEAINYSMLFSNVGENEQDQFKLTTSSYFSTSFSYSAYFDLGLKHCIQCNCDDWDREIPTEVIDFASQTTLSVFATFPYNKPATLWSNPWINTSPLTFEPAENPVDVDVDVKQLRKLAGDCYNLDQKPSPGTVESFAVKAHHDFLDSYSIDPFSLCIEDSCRSGNGSKLKENQNDRGYYVLQYISKKCHSEDITGGISASIIPFPAEYSWQSRSKTLPNSNILSRSEPQNDQRHWRHKSQIHSSDI